MRTDPRFRKHTESGNPRPFLHLMDHELQQRIYLDVLPDLVKDTAKNGLIIEALFRFIERDN